MTQNDRDFRRDKRVTFTMRAPLAAVDNDGSLIEHALTIDLSQSGVRLRLRGQVEPGQIVDVFLSKRPERCRVVWTSPAGPHKELIAGLEFIYPLPDPRNHKTSAQDFEHVN
jgi:hypothetical protein